MTYMSNGEQYIVVGISGAQYSAELLALKRPWQRQADVVTSERRRSNAL